VVAEGGMAGRGGGAPALGGGGLVGTYFLSSRMGERVCVCKPGDEER